LLAGGALAAEDPPTLFVAGDSTASAYEPNPKNQQGWGAVLQPLFDEKKLRVVDVARGGRSSRTFITEGHWDRMLAQLDAGDFVVIQFGHNDSGATNAEPPGSTRPLRARGTIPGIGTESEEIDNVITGKHETVYTFGWYLRKMIAETKAKGATPILFPPTATNKWRDGHIGCPGGYRTWTWQTAKAENVAFVDLLRISGERYQHEGPDKVAAQFLPDTIHTNVAGAQSTAADVLAGLRGLDAPKFDSMLSARGLQIARDKGPEKPPVCGPPGH
jgi:lysophospholipase L1-like esterase